MLDWNDIESYRIAYKNKLRVPKEIILEHINYHFDTGWKGLESPLNLKNPKRLSEKIQWLKLNYKNPILVNYQDKLLYKELLKDKGLEEYSTKLIDQWDTFIDVDFESLLKEDSFSPFVLKPNNMSGGREVFFFTETTIPKVDYLYIEESLEHFSKGYPNITAVKNGEWVYMKIEPKLFAEQYYSPDSLLFSDGVSRPVEFKTYCFNGKVFLVQVNTLMNASDMTFYTPKFFDGRFVLTYNKKWKKLPIRKVGKEVKPIECEEPSYLKEMIEVSEEISKDIPFIRIDWLSSNGKLKTFENALFPSSGYLTWGPHPKENDLLFGELLTLPNKMI